MYNKPRVFGNGGSREVCPWCKTRGWIGHNKNRSGWYLKKRCKCDKFPTEITKGIWGYTFITRKQIRYNDINDYLISILQKEEPAGTFNKQEFLQFYKNSLMARL